MNKVLPGITLAVILTILAKLVSILFIGLNLTLLALGFGVIFRGIYDFVLFKNTDSPIRTLSTGVRFCGDKFLSLAIILFGLKINFAEIQVLGVNLFIFSLIIVLGSIFMGIWLGKFLGLDSKTSILTGIGDGICGSSAIASVKDIIRGEQKDSENSVALSLGAINLVGILALIILPLAFNKNPETLARLLGGSLQSMGHVVASASVLPDPLFNLATTIKMTRVIFLIPLIIFLLIFYNKSEKIGKNIAFTSFKRAPKYLYGFVFLIFIGNLNLLNQSILSFLSILNQFAFALAMVGIGFAISWSLFKKRGSKVVLLAFIIQVIQISFILLTSML